MIIRNRTGRFMFRAIDPSEYLRRTTSLEKPFWEIGHICPPEVLRRIYRHFRHISDLDVVSQLDNLVNE